MDLDGSLVILDFGGQYAHLIGNRIRRLGAYTAILPPETPANQLKDAAGIILSGGPQSVYDKGSPQADPKILKLGIPVLGLCYGLHWLTQTLGGEVKSGKVKEYGFTPIQTVNGGGTLLQDIGGTCTVWMSHGDEAATLPEGFSRIATSVSCANAAFADESRRIYALQFHPEVTHTEHGMDILKRFVDLCDAKPWSVTNFLGHISDQIKEEVGDRKVFMLVSGGVDSTVAFTLLNKVLGHDRVQGLLVDTGLMRKDEVVQIRSAFAELGMTNLHIEDAGDEFLHNLQNVYEPEAKRKAIGDTFLSVQKRVSEKMNLDPMRSSARSGKSAQSSGWMLGQGTIYPDTIETGGTKHADQIKTHHNRVEAIQKMIDQGLVIEPLKELYKDEVRMLGEELGLPHDLVWRQPFPGPGLAVRILCAKKPDSLHDLSLQHDARVLPIKSVGVQGDQRTYRHAVAFFTGATSDLDPYYELATRLPNSNTHINRVLACTSHNNPQPFVFTPGFITKARADLLREADAIADEEMRKAGLYASIWQFPVVLLPIGTHEGGQSHLRSSSSGGQAIVLRPIASVDAMTANAFRLPSDVVQTMTGRIMQLNGIDLVFLDLTNKPPATIEWE